MNSVNVFVFLWKVICLFSLRKAVDYYAIRLNNYYITLGFFRFYVLKNRSTIQKVFGSDPSTAFLNQNFTSSHGMTHTIDSVDPPSQEWKVIHKSVKSAISDLGDEPIRLLNQMFEEAVRETFPRPVDLLDLTDNVIRRWFYVVFVGHEPETTIYEVDPEERIFYDMRESLLEELRYSFYDNRFRLVPILGSLTSSFYSREYRFRSLQRLMRLYLKSRPDQFPNSFYARFKARIHENVEELYNELSEDERSELVDKFFINNSIFTLLVYDFLQMMLMGCVLKKVENGSTIYDSTINTDDMGDIYRHNFLFKHRGRKLIKNVTLDDNHILPRGSIVIADLLDSKLIYSTGKRGCAGQSLARPLIKSFVEQLNSMQIIVLNDKVVRNPDPDVPIIDLEQSEVVGHLYFRDQLKKSGLIPSNTVNGVELHNLWHLYSNKDLHFMIWRWVQLMMEMPIWENAVIVVPEARGLPFATMFSWFGYPIVVFTKEAKFGPTLSEEYSRGYNSESKTIHLYETLADEIQEKGYSQIILVDDGIASGGTLKACLDIIEQKTGKRIDGSIFGIINHTYAERDDNYNDSCQTITMFDY